MDGRQTFGAGRDTYVVLSILFGGMIAMSTYSWLSGHRTFWQPLALLVGAYVVTLVWLRAFRVVITDKELIFRTLFGERRMLHSEIGLIRLGFDLSHGGGPLRLFVESKAEPDVTAMSINAKVLSREAVMAVLNRGSRVARSDTGGLEDGIVMRAIRKRRERKSATHSPKR